MSDTEYQRTPVRLTRGDAARRTAEAWRLRTESALSWREIAERVGYSSAANVQRAVRRWRQSLPALDVARMRDEAIARGEWLVRKAAEDVEQDRPGCVTAMVRAEGRIAQFCGLDAPSRQEVVTTHGLDSFWTELYARVAPSWRSSWSAGRPVRSLRARWPRRSEASPSSRGVRASRGTGPRSSAGHRSGHAEHASGAAIASTGSHRPGCEPVSADRPTPVRGRAADLDQPSTAASLSRMWSMTAVCSTCGLKRISSASRSIRTLCPGGQWKASPAVHVSFVLSR